MTKSDRTRVVVLCHGNRYRSPLAAAFLSKSDLVSVRSAGFGEDGHRAAKPVRQFAKEFGLDLDNHRSQVLSKELYLWAQIILVMDEGNLQRLKAFSEKSLTSAGLEPRRVYGLGAFASPRVKRVPDPAWLPGKSKAFRDVNLLIMQAVSGFIYQLSRGEVEL